MSLTEPDFRNEAAVDPFRVWLRFIRLNQRLYAAMGARLREIGLSIPQFDLISTLTESEGLSQQELAERLYVTKGNVSGLVDRLVAAGLVERRALAGDRRSNALYLTQQGRALAEEGIALQRAYVTETMGQLKPGDIATLERILLDWRDILRSGEKQGRR
jgi:DNA-binding MarR family transcriptional regulator